MLIRLRNSDIPKITVMNRKQLNKTMRKIIVNTEIFGTISSRVWTEYE